jgi:hypothetical protein
MAQEKTMKAIVQDRYGPADVLELREINKPKVGDDDVLVRVHAAGVNPGVWHAMTGRAYVMRLMGFGLRRPKARIRGTDVAGRVEAVGGGQMLSILTPASWDLLFPTYRLPPTTYQILTTCLFNNIPAFDA